MTMYAIGITLVVACFLAWTGLLAAVESNGNDALCGVLIVFIAISCLLGPILLSQGSYDKGYKQGVNDAVVGKVKCDTVYQIKVNK